MRQWIALFENPRQQITDVLEELVREWIAEYPNVHDRRGINEGPCAEFAEHAADVLKERLGIEAEIMNEDEVLEPNGLEMPNYYHTFLYIGGGYYDAEATRGVDDWQSLPFFRRHAHCIKQAEGYDDDEGEDESDLDEPSRS